MDQNSAAARPRRFGRLQRVAALALLLLALDWLQPPARQLSARAAVLAIDLYQATLSQWMPGLGIRCRFEPTCSHYAEAALRCLGFPRAAGLAAWRILRCGPWTELGTHEPPPCGAPAPSAKGEE